MFWRGRPGCCGGPGFGSRTRLQFAKRRQRILTDSPRYCGAKGKICAIGPIVISRMRGAVAPLVLAHLLFLSKIFRPVAQRRGQECVITIRSRWYAYHSQKKKTQKTYKK